MASSRTFEVIDPSRCDVAGDECHRVPNQGNTEFAVRSTWSILTPSQKHFRIIVRGSAIAEQTSTLAMIQLGLLTPLRASVPALTGP